MIGTMLAKVMEPPCSHGAGIIFDTHASTTASAIIIALVVSFFVIINFPFHELISCSRAGGAEIKKRYARSITHRKFPMVPTLALSKQVVRVEPDTAPLSLLSQAPRYLFDE